MDTELASIFDSRAEAFDTLEMREAARRRAEATLVRDAGAELSRHLLLRGYFFVCGTRLSFLGAILGTFASVRARVAPGRAYASLAGGGGEQRGHDEANDEMILR